MKIILDFVTNSSEADYYDCSDCDCTFNFRDCDCDCNCDCDCDYNCDCDDACSLSDYVDEYFDGDWDMFEANMPQD